MPPIIWSDLFTEDMEATLRFYRRWLDWSVVDTDDESSVFMAEGQPVASVVDARGAARGTEAEIAVNTTHWLPYCWVRDLDAALTSAAPVSGPADHPRLGRAATALLPGRVALGLTDRRHAPPSAYGTFDLGSSEPVAMLGVLRELFPEARIQQDDDGYVRFVAPTSLIGSGPRVYLATDDVGGLVARAVTLGAVVVQEPLREEQPSALVRDPAGALVGLTRRVSRPQAA